MAPFNAMVASFVPAARAGCRDTKHYKAHVIHGRVGNESLEVCLSVSGKRTKDDCGGRKESQRACKYPRFKRIERKDEPQEAIRAQLEQDTSQDHRAGGRRFGMRIGQPGMERPDGDFDRKGNGKCPEGNCLHSVGQTCQGAVHRGVQRVPTLI